MTDESSILGKSVSLSKMMKTEPSGSVFFLFRSALVSIYYKRENERFKFILTKYLGGKKDEI